MIAPQLCENWDGKLEALPDRFAPNYTWQYGFRDHVSPPRCILGSDSFVVNTENGNTAMIRHLVVEGSSQWVINQNVTRQANLIHLRDNCLQVICFDEGFYKFDKISLIDLEYHSYIPYQTCFGKTYD